MRARYSLLKKIGGGAFGDVFLASDQATGARVAVKQLKELTPDARARFEREARMLARNINNQHVVDILDAELDVESPYLVLEYCDQGSLRSWVERRRPWNQVVMALIHVLLGLESIHALNGFHRDIKPENLLVTTRDGGLIVKVADFGLARAPLTIQGPMTCGPGGTPGYIAPEILRGIDFHSGADVYSLGVVAIELLTGVRNPSAVHSVEMPAELRRLVLSMVSSAPQLRPQIQAIAHVLDTFGEQAFQTRRAPPKPGPSPQPPQAGAGLGEALFIGGGLLLALAALAGGDKQWDRNVRQYRDDKGRFAGN